MGGKRQHLNSESEGSGDESHKKAEDKLTGARFKKREHLPEGSVLAVRKKLRAGLELDRLLLLRRFRNKFVSDSFCMKLRL